MASSSIRSTREMGNTTDLATIQIWTLEEVAVERGADELRVYLRSWRVDHTTPVLPRRCRDGNTGDE